MYKKSSFTLERDLSVRIVRGLIAVRVRLTVVNCLVLTDWQGSLGPTLAAAFWLLFRLLAERGGGGGGILLLLLVSPLAAAPCV